MGLLDDAIREHLELKRRAGADPGVIAQAEHEALAPIFPEEPGPDVEDPPVLDEQLASVAEEGALPPQAAGPEGGDADVADVVQETVEIDMREVLEDGGQDVHEAMPPATSRPVRAAAGGTPEIDDDAWQAERFDDGPPVEIPGQERLSFE